VLRSMAASAFVAAACLCSEAVLRQSVNVGPPMKTRLPWYHSTDEVHQSVSDLAATCRGAKLELSTRSELNTADSAGTEVVLDIVRVRRTSANISSKAMLVFGLHARELVSVESALVLLQTLCGQGPGDSQFSGIRDRVLDRVEFTIVPNANPIGRKEVEKGYYCKRTNEDSVDLNRNWGDKHRGDGLLHMGDEIDPGPRGFSEPETQILKALVEEVRPDVYLSVHSGAYLLGSPFGYTRGQPKHAAVLSELLRPISERHCGGACPYGGLADLIHYKSEGCDIDYVTEDVGTPFAFTWEIYTGPKFRDPYIAEARERAGDNSDNGADFGSASSLTNFVQRETSLRVMTWRQRLRGRASRQGGKGRITVASLRALLDTPEKEQDAEDCIEQFNPKTEGETTEVVENWTGAYLELCEDVAARREHSGSYGPTPTAGGGQ